MNPAPRLNRFGAPWQDCGVEGCDCGEPLNHPLGEAGHEAMLYAEVPQLEPRCRERKPRMTRAESRERTIANNRRLAALAASLPKVAGK